MKRSLAAASAVFALALAGTTAAEAAAVPDFPNPKIFGTSFQRDPGHDFTKRISPRRDGVLRGWITHVGSRHVEYEPIKWKRAKYAEGYFVGPPEGDVTAYASPIAGDVVYLSAFGCGKARAGTTVSPKTGLGVKRCSRKALLANAKKSRMPGLITVYKGKIVKFQEIYTP
ncbi:hypothetical protein PS9374_04352 [Planomonospora sphaerica]|uniref:Uncharacterized protein n=1 Tax=Planomonospora sphaerica TaxID=161355 RepID=A0A171DIF2_9ACTN|nr:hypothetical protein [Planomonospora sphaerica]GAT68687.1 hypothetical protein PS9374_04352 [Planomonospora sphaerica]